LRVVTVRFSHRHSLHCAALLASVLLSSCGGGSGGAQPSAPTGQSSAPPPRAVEQSDVQIAQQLYAGSPRTPAGFYGDQVPSGHEHVATVHLKNADVDASVSNVDPLFELCTDDWQQAFDWSETSAQRGGEYADLVATNDDARFHEFGRVRAGEPEWYLRSRVFKCSYLDRSAGDLRRPQGAAGVLRRQPLTAEDLRSLSEYLWQFTTYNNFGHIVLKSSGSSPGAIVTHTLHMASLNRLAYSSTCDRIDVFAWTHTAQVATGELQLSIQPLWSFGARDAGGGVAQLCSQ
jgi:hypothetical protein